MERHFYMPEQDSGDPCGHCGLGGNDKIHDFPYCVGGGNRSDELAIFGPTISSQPFDFSGENKAFARVLVHLLNAAYLAGMRADGATQ